MKCFGGVGCGTIKNPLDFGGDPDHDRDSGIFFKDSDQMPDP